jgi:ABC-type nitrate/sulfonate/bicarbonate transport system ATPase subunit
MIVVGEMQGSTMSEAAGGEVGLSGVSQIYETKHSTVTALSHVNVRFQRGEVTCLLGPSGCGKSTILKLIAGLEKPTEGSIEIDGRAVGSPGPDRSLVFQSPALFPWLSVWDNVAFGPKRQRVPKAQWRADAQELMEIAGLSTFARHYPYQLSGGMKQRVQIVRSFINQPKILLMDEPFGALDAQTRMEMQEYFLALADRYRPTVVFVTHDVEESLLVGDRVCVMSSRPGRIAHTLDVALPKPRDHESVTDAAFVDLRRIVMSMLISDQRGKTA